MANRESSTTADIDTQGKVSEKAGLQYELPPLVESLRQGRIATYSAASVVTALFVSVEATLFTGSIPPSDISLHDPDATGSNSLRGTRAIHRFYFLATFAALMFNLSATVCSLLLIDILGAMAKWQKQSVKTFRTGRRILMHFDVGGTYSRIELVWYLMLILGSIAMFGQFLLYVWLYESDVVASVTIGIVIIAILPFIILAIPTSEDGNRNSIASA